MYTGHAAIALILRSRRPAVPMLPLVLASYGPDWVDWALMLPTPREGMAPYSHSIPAVLGGALIAALLYEAVMKRPGAGVIALAWISHWPADLVTGVKPVIGLDFMVGLDVYHIPWLDFVIEMLLLSLACLEYAHVFAPSRRQRVIVALTALALALTQAVMDVAVSRLDPSVWRPSLAHRGWQPHVSFAAGLPAPSIALHASCTARLQSQGSESCRRRESRVSSRWSA